MHRRFSQTQRYCMLLDLCFNILLFISASYTLALLSIVLSVSPVLCVRCWFRSCMLGRDDPTRSSVLDAACTLHAPGEPEDNNDRDG